MNFKRRLYSMTSGLAVASMIAAPMQPVFAQDAPGPGGSDANYGQDSGGDPPSRVGRLAIADGTVSYHAGGDDHWSPATLNQPVANGDAFWTEPQALAKIEVTASAVWMDSSTEFDLTTLDDTSMHAAEPQGEAYMHLRTLGPRETYTIETPRGTVTMAVDGRYDIVAGDTQHPTMVTVLDGAAQITGNNISLQVHANQTASIDGDTTFQGSVGPMVQDDFLQAMLKREAPRAVAANQGPPVVAQMTGGEDLSQYGQWQDNSDYGQVWYPQVGTDWAPYREGSWSYREPWGWTWDDAAPWGFAPFHYGRWVQIGPRWGWAPGYAGFDGGYDRPVYAPALVSFFGIGVAVGVGIGFGFGHDRGGFGRDVGWVPLGPREAYYPPYRASRGYLTRVNVTNIRNVTNIYNERNARRDLPVDRFANGRFATVVPGRAMQDSRSIAGAYRKPTDKELAGAHGLDRSPIGPGANTAGLTPRAARELKVNDYKPRSAPGPQLRGEGHAGHGALPPLRGGGGPDRNPGAPGPAMRGGPNPGGLPGLRNPGGRIGEPVGHPGERGPGAPGPQISHGEGGHPGLRAPGATPPGLARGEAGGDRGPRGNEGPTRGPAETNPQPGARGGPEPHASGRRETPAPGRAEPGRPVGGPEGRPQPVPHDTVRPQPVRPQVSRPQEARAPAERPHVAAPRPQMARPMPRPEAPRAPAPRPEASRPQAPRPEGPRPQASRPQAPRPEAPHPQAPHPQGPRPGGNPHQPGHH